jgi:hypothetical protein
MSKTIAKPKLVAQRPPVFDEAPAEIRPEKNVESISRANVEIWNSSFPRRAWLNSETETMNTTPHVRPAGHERAGRAPESQPDELTQILNAMQAHAPRTGELPGLCRNCARLDDCTYPKPEGGVWHCNEYE